MVIVSRQEWVMGSEFSVVTEFFYVATDELKSHYFQSIFLIDFYIKRLIYMQEYGITLPSLLCSRKFKRKQKLQ